MPMQAPRGVAKFDSAPAMLRALAACLHGHGFPGLAMIPARLAPLGRLVNTLPEFMREEIYIWSGWWEAISSKRLRDLHSEEVARWLVRAYPRRRYPGVAIGSSSGALVHLCAALGIPWLPQTFLVVVQRHGISPDEPQDELQWGREVARPFLDVNPELLLHHMQDPCQDRLMVREMAYFRAKWLRLGATYQQFLRDALQPGGTIFLSECQLSWPTLQAGDRYVL
jgi:hypothetical protein